MVISAKTWRRSTLIYRALVAAQTIVLAATALANVISRRPRAAQAGAIGIWLVIAAVVALAGGLLTYYARTPRPRDRRTIILTWAWLQGGGLVALVGYAITGETVCFVGAVIMLAVMHAFSPNRFRGDREPER